MSASTSTSPTHGDGDCFSRFIVRLMEMRESLKIVKQAAADMPDGPYVNADCRYPYPPRKAGLNNIETLIHHFVNTSRGLTPPRGECYRAIESSKGECGYYLVSEGASVLAGILVLPAHPERIRYFQDDLTRYETIVRQGAYGQITTGSVLGQFGDETRAFSEELVRRRLVHVIASDAHNVRGRAPRLSEAVRAVYELSETFSFLVGTDVKNLLRTVVV